MGVIGKTVSITSKFGMLAGAIGAIWKGIEIIEAELVLGLGFIVGGLAVGGLAVYWIEKQAQEQ